MKIVPWIMMFILRCMIMLIPCLIILGLVLFVVWLMYTLFQFGKKSYVYFNIKQIKRVELHKPFQTYKKLHERTGYSIGYGRNGTYREYYRIKHVPDGMAREVVVCFENSLKVSIVLKEYSWLYRKIIEHCRKVK